MKTMRMFYSVVLSMLVAFVLASTPASAKEKVKVGFIGPLTGGTSSNGIGGRNSAECW